jgi:hypothetical protein
MKFPWKKSFLKVPQTVRSALQGISGDLILVAATKKVPCRDIASGLYAHLGLRLEDGFPEAGEPLVPDSAVGKWSMRNVYGWEIKRTDLPMITKTFIWETPNFGDGSTYGWHTHYQDREVYQRQIFEPRMLKIETEIMNEASAETALVKFSLGELLDRARPNFEDDLLFALNLLQENTGATGVFASDASREDFVGTIALDWEVFPPGTAEEVIASLRKSKGGFPPDFESEARSRTALFSKLQPDAYLKGSGSFGSYFGAIFADDLVVFENLQYGNALYVLYNDWQEVSKRSRLDLLNGTDANYDRFRHDEGWEARFVSHMQLQLKRRGKRLPRRLL